MVSLCFWELFSSHPFTTHRCSQGSQLGPPLFLLSVALILFSCSATSAQPTVTNAHVCISSISSISLSLFKVPFSISISVFYNSPEWRAGTLNSICSTQNSLSPFSLTSMFPLSVHVFLSVSPNISILLYPLQCICFSSLSSPVDFCHKLWNTFHMPLFSLFPMPLLCFRPMCHRFKLQNQVSNRSPCLLSFPH